MAETIIKNDPEYLAWVKELSERYRRSQIKAAVSVNREMLVFYWRLGKDIADLHAESRWGSGFFETLSRDLNKEIPGARGFSARNLRYMKRFYELFPVVPWGHIRTIIDKCRGDREKAEFYIRKTVDNGWSRAVLLNYLDSGLYERQGKAVNNFSCALPAPQGDLAREITRDPYQFDFLSIRDDYDEHELKDALMTNISQFLMELGTGFALLGREYRLLVGKTEQWIDLLFYHAVLHCYVVIEVKAADFRPEYVGQLGTYVVAVNHILKGEVDQPTVGLLICKGKDDVLAQYAVEGSSQPIGISEYELSKLVPEELRSSLPTIEEIEAELRG